MRESERQAAAHGLTLSRMRERGSNSRHLVPDALVFAAARAENNNVGIHAIALPDFSADLYLGKKSL
jgi:hypothetical protein